MTDLTLAWLAVLAAVFVGGIVLYVFVIRPNIPDEDEAGNVYGRFE